MIEIKNIQEVLNYIKPYKVIIFDLDDTLYLERDYVASGFHAVADSHPEIDNLFNELWDAFLEKKSAIDVVCEQHKSLNKDELLSTYRSHKPNINLSDETKMLLDYLRDNKTLTIITDGRPEGQQNKIDALGLESYFSRIIITDELGGIEFRKPCTKAFEMIKDWFGVDFQDMVYIGDNLKKDGEAPKKLGMSFIYFNNKDGLYR